MAGSLNKVLLIGRLGADPEIKQMVNGKSIARFSLATSNTWKDKNTGERKEKTEWHRVVIFNEGLVNVVQQYVKKGAQVYIEGQLSTRKWTDEKSGQDKYSTEIVLQGGVDDVWFNTKTEELIVVDYKSQASTKEVSQATYFPKGGFHDSYKTQLNFYAYLMKGMKLEYEISRDSYLYVVNGLDVEEGFNGKIKFSETLIHHKIETDYLDNEIQNMIDTINSDKIPDADKSCKNCAYARRRSLIDKM